MTVLTIDVVCCDDSSELYTRLVTRQIDADEIQQRVIETIEQDLEPGRQRGLHNAAHHPVHGAVTYFQTVHSGGFTVTYGDPDQLSEAYFSPGALVAFSDDRGPGHGSRVGPDGVVRTMRILKGLL